MRALALATIAAAAIGTSGAASSAGVPAELNDARRALASAVSSHDVSGAANWMHFPLHVDMYGAPNSMSEDVFTRDPRQFKGMFYDGSSGIVHCLEGTAPEPSTDFSDAPWVIDCNGNEYYFGQYSGRWRMGAYANINE